MRNLKKYIVCIRHQTCFLNNVMRCFGSRGKSVSLRTVTIHISNECIEKIFLQQYNHKSVYRIIAVRFSYTGNIVLFPGARIIDWFNGVITIER